VREVVKQKGAEKKEITSSTSRKNEGRIMEEPPRELKSKKEGSGIFGETYA